MRRVVERGKMLEGAPLPNADMNEIPVSTRDWCLRVCAMGLTAGSQQGYKNVCIADYLTVQLLFGQLRF